MESDTCSICGGDGRIGNAFGRTTTCPGCHGSGRKDLSATGMRDVTKTKPSHHQQKPVGKVVPEKRDWPSTFEGGQLATEVKDSNIISNETKAKIIREIIEYEGSHGQCTQTFSKKVRKQLRPPA